MARRICQYFLTIATLIDDPEIPDSTCRRYQQLLKRSYEESGPRYAPLSMSNRELADVWQCHEGAARAALAEMRSLHLVDTEQVGRTGRIIKLLVAWRSTGSDSAEDINATSARAQSREAPATATQAPAQPTVRSSFEGAGKVRTLASSPNSVVVGTDLREKHARKTTTNTITRAREIFAQLGVVDPALSLLASTVSEERAETWDDWLSDPPASFTAPVAYAIKRLTADPMADPPANGKAKAYATVGDTLRQMREKGLIE